MYGDTHLIVDQVLEVVTRVDLEVGTTDVGGTMLPPWVLFTEDGHHPQALQTPLLPRTPLPCSDANRIPQNFGLEKAANEQAPTTIAGPSPPEKGSALGSAIQDLSTAAASLFPNSTISEHRCQSGGSAQTRLPPKETVTLDMLRARRPRHSTET